MRPRGDSDCRAGFAEPVQDLGDVAIEGYLVVIPAVQISESHAAGREGGGKRKQRTYPGVRLLPHLDVESGLRRSAIWTERTELADMSYDSRLQWVSIQRSQRV